MNKQHSESEDQQQEQEKGKAIDTDWTGLDCKDSSSVGGYRIFLSCCWPLLAPMMAVKLAD